MKWHAMDSSAVQRQLETDAATGLDELKVAQRIAQYGRNELTGAGIRSAWAILWDQLRGLMVVILIAAAVVSALLADYKDAVAIGAIVILNAMIGWHGRHHRSAEAKGRSSGHHLSKDWDSRRDDHRRSSSHRHLRSRSTRNYR